ncbi:MAG: hypothetical protein Q9196_006285 [Gyalolechia fulgens]
MVSALVTELIWRLPNRVLDNLDSNDHTYVLEWAIANGISNREVMSYTSPYKIQNLLSHFVLLPGDRLTFEVRGQTWTVVLLGPINSRTFSVRTVAPSPQSGITASNCTGFQIMTRNILQAHNPVRNANFPGKALRYSSITARRNGRLLGNLAFLRSAKKLHHDLMKQWATM